VKYHKNNIHFLTNTAAILILAVEKTKQFFISEAASLFIIHYENPIMNSEE